MMQPSHEEMLFPLIKLFTQGQLHYHQTTFEILQQLKLHQLQCRNLSFGLATKARGCKVAGQVKDPGVASNAPGSAKSVRE